MLLQAGKWYNYYLFFWCSHFWHACHEFLRIYVFLCTTSFVCDIFFTLFVRTIRSYHHFTSGKKKSLKLYYQKMKNIKEKKSPWNLKIFLVYYCKMRIQWFSLQNWKIDTSLLKPLWLTPGICSKSILLESARKFIKRIVFIVSRSL